jgi:hypothetical protein
LLFRSRLEARWAVFFDTLRIKYAYEPEGFALQGGNYLPDFYIPNQRTFRHGHNGLFVEVKGIATEKAHGLLDDLTMHTGIPSVMLGEIPYGECDTTYAKSIESWFQPAIDEEWHINVRHKAHAEGCKEWFIDDDCSCGMPTQIGGDFPYVWCQCPFCQMLGFEFDGRSARIGCGCVKHESFGNGDKTYNSGALDLLRAYSAARRARFEDWRGNR